MVVFPLVLQKTKIDNIVRRFTENLHNHLVWDQGTIIFSPLLCFAGETICWVSFDWMYAQKKIPYTRMYVFQKLREKKKCICCILVCIKLVVHLQKGNRNKKKTLNFDWSTPIFTQYWELKILVASTQILESYSKIWNNWIFYHLKRIEFRVVGEAGIDFSSPLYFLNFKIVFSLT